MPKFAKIMFYGFMKLFIGLLAIGLAISLPFIFVGFFYGVAYIIAGLYNYLGVTLFISIAMISLLYTIYYYGKDVLDNHDGKWWI